MIRRFKWFLPVALLIAGAAASVALGAAALPGFSKHTAISVDPPSTTTIDSTNAPGTISRPDVINNVDCGSADGNGHVVWFTWLADESTSITANTNGSAYDTVLYLLQRGKKIACDDDTLTGATCGGQTHCSQIVFDSVEGIRYYFAVAAFDGSSGGDTHLNLFD